MALVPFSYTLRSLLRRKSATALTAVGIGATVAVVAGVLALQQGFATLFTDHGSEDVAVFLRPGSTNEGDSVFTRERKDVLVKTLPEIATGADGLPLASGELYLAVRRAKVDGGETNVPVRGVEPASFRVYDDALEVVEGRRFEPGTDEVVVGHKLVGRIRNCGLGDTIIFNVTPFRVVGVFESDGPFSSEIWGDRDRLAEALDRPVYNRVVARLRDGTDWAALTERLEDDAQVPAKLLTEREYLSSQTQALSFVLIGLGVFLSWVMGIGAVFTSTNTMLSAIASRTHEIGILLSIGYRPFAIFVSFLLESLLLGLLGGALGCLFTLPLSGIETGTTNFQTFTEVAFAFRVTGVVLVTAVAYSLVLGLIGGAWPAWRAARLKPTEALRRG